MMEITEVLKFIKNSD
uniref:Uncharacterized protein n=1 Tax=Rhizophora mucronata TaxID=61149 RepID=A0A2P2QW96_RHIMU